jgi:tetratricopeptide (TPR) repeat protein
MPEPTTEAMRPLETVAPGIADNTLDVPPRDAGPPPSADETRNDAIDERARRQVERLLQAPPSAQTRMDLRRYLETNIESPHVVDVLLRIGQVSLVLNDPVEARKAYETAEHIAGGDAARRQSLIGQATTAVAAAEFDRALQLWQRLDAGALSASESAQALAGRATAMAAKGDLESADRIWDALAAHAAGMADSAQSGDWTRKARLGRALTAELRGADEDARRLYLQVVEQAPASDDAALARRRVEDLNRPLVTVVARPPSAGGGI